MKIFLSKTKTSFRRSSSGSPFKKVVLLGGVSVALVFMLGTLFAGSLSFFVEPLRTVRASLTAGFDTVALVFSEKQALSEENKTLRNRLSAYTSVEDRLRMLEEENAILRSFGTEYNTEIYAGVLSRPSDTPYDTVLVDKGSRDGVQEGAVVSAPDNVVIGTVAKVFPGSALVALASTGEMRSSAYIYGPDIFTYVEGQGGGALRVTVPQGISLEEGNIVVLPGVPGKLYGSIRHVEAPDSSPGQYGYITTDVPLQSLHVVSISNEPYEAVAFDVAREAVEALRGEMFSLSIPEDVLVEEATSTPPSSQ